MDPCDLLVQQGPEPFQAALSGAVDALDFKLVRVLKREGAESIEGRRRAVDAVLGVIALAPELPGQAGAMKRELMVTRIAQRLALKEETIWARLEELRQAQRSAPHDGGQRALAPEPQGAPAAAEERQLLEVLLAEPVLVPMAAAEVAPEHIQHSGLRGLLAGLYGIQAAGEAPELDRLRLQIDNPRLAAYALRMQEVGRMMPDRPATLRQILEVFRKRRVLPIIQELHTQLHAATDHDRAVELLRRLQNPKVDLDTGNGPPADPRS
jgi:DNA primase